MVKSTNGGIAPALGIPNLSARQDTALGTVRAAGTSDQAISACLPHAPNPEGLARMKTTELRKHFLLEHLFEQDRMTLFHSGIDRAIVGGAVPASGPLDLGSPSELRSEYFTQHRELGAFNIGGPGAVWVGDTSFRLAPRDAIYLGRGNRDVHFTSEDGNSPAVFYFVSYLAHADHGIKVIREDEAESSLLGTAAQANRRTIRKYICPRLVETCQLTMGLTTLETGSVWNTMPAHRHSRRSEIYFYFDLPEDALVIHCLGEPEETRHILVRNRQAVVAPSWSLHFGAGTTDYSFIWAMGGENREFADMDGVPMTELA